MNMKEYIEQKIQEIEHMANPGYYLQSVASSNSDLRRMWKEEVNKKDLKWRKVNTNQDVYDLIDRFDGAVSFVENHVPYGAGHIEDGYNMMLGLYNALQALRKLAQFVDQISKPWSNTGFSNISEAEVDEMFVRLKSIIKRMEDQNMRRAMQD